MPQPTARDPRLLVRHRFLCLLAAPPVSVWLLSAAVANGALPSKPGEAKLQAVALLADNGNRCGALLAEHFQALGAVREPSVQTDDLNTMIDMTFADAENTFLATHGHRTRGRTAKAAELAEARIEETAAAGQNAIAEQLWALHAAQDGLCRMAAEPFPSYNDPQELIDQGKRYKAEVLAARSALPAALRVEDSKIEALLLPFDDALRRAEAQGAGGRGPKFEYVSQEELRARRQELADRNALEEERQRVILAAESARRASAEEQAKRELPKINLSPEAARKLEQEQAAKAAVPQATAEAIAATKTWHARYQRGIVPFKRALGLLYSVDRRRPALRSSRPARASSRTPICC